jgi:hypothetical protein
MSDEREAMERWHKDIEGALTNCVKDRKAAATIMHRLNANHGVRFGGGCLDWITLLVGKWRARTPDVKQQADSVSVAIIRVMMSNYAKANQTGTCRP